jgi:hypothetical protein
VAHRAVAAADSCFRVGPATRLPFNSAAANLAAIYALTILLFRRLHIRPTLLTSTDLLPTIGDQKLLLACRKSAARLAFLIHHRPSVIPVT